ncbi:hypothetical protein AGMMS50222_10330 [Endomicrobiia bacterium]|nr:hypothetical protein AGMMS49531_10100 [Endomicrobiia bacterium]GHT67448.1 hypothetical protein AGMMS49556_09040 [Endomicrobiia bacterium]GHT71172.1 hypothetical protein AGMMS49950_07340 [Endomicrobiia bacterium]GHT77007.1 hypothetical protein AGMMS50222_10330 [Endomicrobiia bacterium]
MDWNNQKILKLGEGTSYNDAINLRQLVIGNNLLFQTGYGHYSIMAMFNRTPTQIDLSHQFTGMRIFIKFPVGIIRAIDSVKNSTTGKIIKSII